MNRLLTVTAGSLIALATATASQAQIVRVGPFGGVEVRLPRLGVSVDVLPFGQGSRVRAPFTAVDTGVYRYGYPVWSSGSAPAYPAPLYPPADPSLDPAAPLQNDGIDDTAQAMADPNAVAEALREAASQLHRELSQRPDGGEAWLDYLAPQQIIAAIDQGSDRRSLRSLLNHYEGVANSQLPDVYSTPGFRETHELLDQWVNGASQAAAAQADQPQQPATTADPPSNSPDPSEPREPGETDEPAAEELPAPAPSLDE